MAIRELRLFEDPDLQKASRPVAEANDHIRRLLDDLEDTMRSLPGCAALAANQVGVFRRVAVVDMGGIVLKLVNPVITEQSGSQEIEEECVSFKDIRGIMFRPQHITLQALDENGEKVTRSLEGEHASLLCHVIDHMDGKIMVKEVMRFVSAPPEDEE